MMLAFITIAVWSSWWKVNTIADRRCERWSRLWSSGKGQQSREFANSFTILFVTKNVRNKIKIVCHKNGCDQKVISHASFCLGPILTFKFNGKISMSWMWNFQHFLSIWRLTINVICLAKINWLKRRTFTILIMVQ